MVATRSQTKEILNRIATELHDALVGSDWPRAQSLLQQIPAGEHLPRTAPGRVEPLFMAATTDQNIPLDLFRSILRSFENLLPHEDYGRSLPAIGDNILTPIHFSILMGIDLRLMEATAVMCRASLMHPMRTGQRNSRYTIIDIVLSSEQYSETKKAEILAMLLRLCPELAHFQYDGGRNIIHTAIISRTPLPTIQVILEVRPELVQSAMTGGVTPMHLPVFEQYRYGEGDYHVAVLRLLLRYADEDLLNKKNDKGITLLEQAAVQDTPVSDRIVDLLVEACPSACRHSEGGGKTPLFIFNAYFGARLLPSDYDTEEMVRLTRFGNCAWALFTALPSHKRPRLHSILLDPHLPVGIISCILCASLTELNQRDNDGNLPIHILANRRPEWDGALLYTEAVKTIIHLYPEACRLPDAQGRLPLELMKRSGHSLRHVMEPLLRAHPAAAMDLGMDHVSLRFLFAQVGRIETDSLYRFLQGAPETIKTIDNAAQGKRRRRRRGG